MQVTLGYLRSLEVPVLRVENMPRLDPIIINELF